MADGPGSGRPEDGTDFNWLYGRRPGGSAPPPPPPPPAADDDRPEATRVLPVQPRPGTSSAAGSTPSTPSTPPRPAPTPGPAPAPGPPPPPHRGRPLGGGFWARRLRRPRFYVRMVMLLVLLFVIYTVAVPFIAWKQVDAVAWEPDGDRPAEQDGTTYLMIGSDSRANLSAEERREFSTGNSQANLTDTIMLLHTGSGPNLLLSIPRDTEVDQPGFGTGKINSAYARGGPELLVQIIERETGIRIDDYVEIGLGGVPGVVDAVGGIEVCPKQAIRDPAAGLRIKKGCQDVDGATALGYSRSRKTSAFGDLDRVARQREVVSAIGDKVLSPWTVLNPVRWWKLNNSVPGFFAFGEGMGKVQAAKWATAMAGVDKTCTMPVTDLTATTWDPERSAALFDAIIDDETDRITDEECTANGLAP